MFPLLPMGPQTQEKRASDGLFWSIRIPTLFLQLATLPRSLLHICITLGSFQSDFTWLSVDSLYNTMKQVKNSSLYKWESFRGGFFKANIKATVRLDLLSSSSSSYYPGFMSHLHLSLEYMLLRARVWIIYFCIFHCTLHIICLLKAWQFESFHAQNNHGSMFFQWKLGRKFWPLLFFIPIGHSFDGPWENLRD